MRTATFFRTERKFGQQERLLFAAASILLAFGLACLLTIQIGGQ